MRGCLARRGGSDPEHDPEHDPDPDRDRDLDRDLDLDLDPDRALAAPRPTATFPRRRLFE
ncbi:MAG TPA: hypothetical protein VF341_12975 [Anaeromyxobacteraceae bacterium]